MPTSTRHPSTLSRYTDWTTDRDDIASVIDGLDQYIRSTTTLDRADRLWPADYTVFGTNPVSLAHGAIGPALFLGRGGRSLPDGALAWIKNHIDEKPLPPGLYTGAAGVAYGLAAMGEVDEGLALLRNAANHPLKEKEAGFYHGLAGWGWTCLAIYQKTGDSFLLEEARAAATTLIERAEKSTDGWSWPNEEEDTPCPLGLQFGAAGISLFFTALAHTTGTALYADAAHAALSFELAHAKHGNNGQLTFGGDIEHTGTSPYVIRGTAGHGIAFLRYAQLTGDEAMINAAVRAARGCRGLFSGYPNHMDGMSGIGHFLLDVYLETGDETARGQTDEYVESILCFKIDMGDTVAFPGRLYARISNDYASGGAGVGLFLDRYLNPSPRDIYDLP